MQLLEKIVNVFQPPLNIFVESCILDVCLGSEYVSELSPTLKKMKTKQYLLLEQVIFWRLLRENFMWVQFSFPVI